jgi:hypothetical protein
MPAEDTSTSLSGLDVNKLLRELEAPFSPDHVQWRVTNTTNDKKRGQVVPYADPRAYTDRLNALLSLEKRLFACFDINGNRSVHEAVPHQQHINAVLNGQTCLVRSARLTTRLFEANKNMGRVVFPA